MLSEYYFSVKFLYNFARNKHCSQQKHTRMKRIILSLLSVATITTAANAQLAIAPELGLNMANMAMKSGGTTISTSMKAGLAVGAAIDLGLTDNIYFQPGLFYLMNGAKATVSGIDATYSLNTIQIPLNFEYKLGDDGDNRFFFGVGPYIGYNLSGTSKAGGTSNTLKIGSTKPDASGNGGDDVKAMDFGAGVNIGYLLANGFFARVHYQMGFAELDPIGDANNSLKSSALGVTVGYYFGAKKGKSGAAKK